MRIASFLPSATEIVHALGLGDSLVGRSHECDHPPAVRTLPPVVQTLIDVDGRTSAEIDAQVRASMGQNQSLYQADLALLKQLKPDLLLTQDLCNVCAPAGPLAQEVERALPGTRILSLNPRSIEGILTTIIQVGEATGADRQARALCDSLRARLDAVRRSVAGRARTRVVVLEWTDPLFCCGHWVPEMVDAAGGVELIGRAGTDSRRIEWKDLHDANPDLVIVAPCGYHTPKCEALMRELVAQPEWRGRRVVAADADSHFARPGPRVVNGVEWLAATL